MPKPSLIKRLSREPSRSYYSPSSSSSDRYEPSIASSSRSFRSATSDIDTRSSRVFQLSPIPPPPPVQSSLKRRSSKASTIDSTTSRGPSRAASPPPPLPLPSLSPLPSSAPPAASAQSTVLPPPITQTGSGAGWEWSVFGARKSLDIERAPALRYALAESLQVEEDDAKSIGASSVGTASGEPARKRTSTAGSRRGSTTSRKEDQPLVIVTELDSSANGKGKGKAKRASSVNEHGTSRRYSTILDPNDPPSESSSSSSSLSSTFSAPSAVTSITTIYSSSPSSPSSPYSTTTLPTSRPQDSKSKRNRQSYDAASSSSNGGTSVEEYSGGEDRMRSSMLARVEEEGEDHLKPLPETSKEVASPIEHGTITSSSSQARPISSQTLHHLHQFASNSPSLTSEPTTITPIVPGKFYPIDQVFSSFTSPPISPQPPSTTTFDPTPPPPSTTISAAIPAPAVAEDGPDSSPRISDVSSPAQSIRSVTSSKRSSTSAPAPPRPAMSPKRKHQPTPSTSTVPTVQVVPATPASIEFPVLSSPPESPIPQRTKSTRVPPPSSSEPLAKRSSSLSTRPLSALVFTPPDIPPIIVPRAPAIPQPSLLPPSFLPPSFYEPPPTFQPSPPRRKALSVFSGAFSSSRSDTGRSVASVPSPSKRRSQLSPEPEREREKLSISVIASSSSPSSSSSAVHALSLSTRVGTKSRFSFLKSSKPVQPPKRPFNPSLDLVFGVLHPPLPKKVKNDEVLVQVLSVGLDAWDDERLSERFAKVEGAGWVPGRSYCGKVLEVGATVGRVKKGDLVWGLNDLKKSGALAQKIIVDKDFVSRAPELNANPEQLAMMPLVGVDAVQVMESICQTLPKGSKILIIGAGDGVGNMCIRLAFHFRSTPDLWIVAQCLPSLSNGQARCKAAGASDIIVSDPLAAIDSLHESSFDVVIDTLGGRRLYDASRRVLHHGGTFITTVGDELSVANASLQWSTGVRSIRRTFFNKENKAVRYWAVHLDRREYVRETLDKLREAFEATERTRAMVSQVVDLGRAKEAFVGGVKEGTVIKLSEL